MVSQDTCTQHVSSELSRPGPPEIVAALLRIRRLAPFGVRRTSGRSLLATAAGSAPPRSTKNSSSAGAGQRPGPLGPVVSVLTGAAVFALAHGLNPVLPVAFTVASPTPCVGQRRAAAAHRLGVVVRGVSDALAMAVPVLTPVGK
ncbi:hypothetical protein [Streptomyces sp. NPDC102462]|uniref:hypothetical protein n=1 Tax=Streptomyces sp. NPDC102462 TaxID=3366178 RepID=UPI0038156299